MLFVVTWLFWTLSNAATAVYCSTVIRLRLPARCWGMRQDACVASLTVIKRPALRLGACRSALANTRYGRNVG